MEGKIHRMKPDMYVQKGWQNSSMKFEQHVAKKTRHVCSNWRRE